jgi:hypothetical protein
MYVLWVVITVLAVIAFIAHVEQGSYFMSLVALALAVMSAGEVLRNRP